jgi:hypothetical protein
VNTLTSSSNTATTSTGAMGAAVLAAQNRRFQGTGGVSRENRSLGFSPAFRDTGTGVVYLSRFASGAPAPMHLLDGLPDTLVVSRSACGRVLQAHGSVVAGFVRDGRFFSREEASRAVASDEGRLS